MPVPQVQNHALATKKGDVVYCGDIEDAAVTCEPSVCAVVDCVAEAVPEPAQASPEAVAAPTPAVAKSKSVKRTDNVAVEPVAGTAVGPTPKRVVEAAPRRGLCAMVASASI